jgi:hypothetical protein
MRQDNDAGVLIADRTDFGRSEALVHLAMAGPADDLDACVGRDVLCEVFVGQHDHSVDVEDWMTFRALLEVQQMSDSAFTAAEVLT